MIHANIVIPTYNRSHCLSQAINSALEQSHDRKTVTVIDDASTDATRSVAARYFDHPNFLYVRLRTNLGTAQAKNLGALLVDCDAVTFHDSDDIPHRDKVLRQTRVMAQRGVEAHPVLNWRICGKTPEQTLQIGAVLSHHELLLPDGQRVEIRRTLSLVDDMFPNLQMAAGVPGDWTHINSGLFHRSVFARLGGFRDCIEEDREFRNRLIMSGEVIWVIPDILLTKIETADSLTQSKETDYDSDTRMSDRLAVWRAVENWFKSGTVESVPIDIPSLDIAEVSRPELCTLMDAKTTAGTLAALQKALTGKLDIVA